jgi:hypothetical protein
MESLYYDVFVPVIVLGLLLNDESVAKAFREGQGDVLFAF